MGDGRGRPLCLPDSEITHESSRRHRRSIRLPSYDYAQAGAYFVTIVSHRRRCLFGDVANGEVVLTSLGRVIEEEWLRSLQIRPGIELDVFVIMPNHFHGIVCIHDGPVVGAHSCAPLPQAPLSRPPRSLGSFIAGFKSVATKRINKMRGTPGSPVWQRNYYEHVIRDEQDLADTRQYIAGNPQRWPEDRENPDIVGAGPRALPRNELTCLTP